MSATATATKFPRFRLGDDVYDRRHPERVGRFNGWVNCGFLGIKAHVRFRGGGKVMIPAEHVTSRRTENARRIGAVYGQRLGAAKRAANLIGLTIEQYWEAVS